MGDKNGLILAVLVISGSFSRLSSGVSRIRCAMLLRVFEPGSGVLPPLLVFLAKRHWLVSPSMTKKPVSPPPEVTLTTGESDKRTIAPSMRPANRNGFVSTYIG